MPEIASFRSVIELWETREALAGALGAGSRTVSKWWQRDRIPEDWWSPIAESVRGRSAGVTVALLASLAARRRTARAAAFDAVQP